MRLARVLETAIEQDGPADCLYGTCLDLYAPALDRLAAAYEADPDLRRDLVQEILTALWRSLRDFDQRCSLRTWTYRVAHNTASSYVARQIRWRSRDWVSLETIEDLPGTANPEASLARSELLARVMTLVQQLRPPDKQVILLYLEGLDAASIAGVTGMSAGSVATKIHRIKNILSKQFHQGGNNARG